MKKSIENIPACSELNPLAMDLIGRLNTSEFVIGACHLLRCRCVGQFKTVDASGWTIEVQILFRVFIFIHTLCILVTKSDASLNRLAWVFVGRKCNTYPKHMCWLKYSMDNPRHMRTVLFYLIQTTVYRST